MTVYTINCYDETNFHPRLDFFDLFQTKEIATNRLRSYAKELKAGKWYNCGFLEWHDEDENDVTWMRYGMKNLDGTVTTFCLSIEERSVLAE